MSDKHYPNGTPWRNFYGRLRGKTLRATQKDALAHDLGTLSLQGVNWEDNPDRAPLDLCGLFGGRPVWLEVGFGGGEHMVHLAGAHPEVGLIGCEPFINGVAMLLRQISLAGVENILIHPGDVRHLFDVLPAGTLARVYLLYPDPWPKRRHHRRRFVTPDYLNALTGVMAPGAELRVATDIPDYVRQTLAEVPRAGFELVSDPSGGFAMPWDGWSPTRYERKALREGRSPHYLIFRKA